MVIARINLVYRFKTHRSLTCLKMLQCSRPSSLPWLMDHVGLMIEWKCPLTNSYHTSKVASLLIFVLYAVSMFNKHIIRAIPSLWHTHALCKQIRAHRLTDQDRNLLSFQCRFDSYWAHLTNRVVKQQSGWQVVGIQLQNLSSLLSNLAQRPETPDRKGDASNGNNFSAVFQSN